MSTRFLLLLGMFVLLVLPVLSGAAEPVDQSTISPGDTLRITVLGEPEHSKDVVVGDDGRISLPLAKDIEVAGLTTSAAAEAIANSLGKYLKNPNVTVEVTQKARKLVTVTGQVRTPGVYPIELETTLMEVIGLAGGFTEMADTANVTVTRRESLEPISCNLQSFLIGTDETANVRLQDGDVILVPEKSPTLGIVFVYGAVNQPGQPIQLREGMRISQAISAAGGILPAQAELTRATLKRQGEPEPIPIDLAKALAGDLSADLVLNSGDTITVPTIEQTGTYTIYGAVANSGEFPLKSNMTISKVVALAGTTGNANMSDLRITRSSEGGTLQAIKVDLKKISAGKAEDVAIQPGDTIYVTERAERRDLTRWLALGLTLIGILIRN
ncbi:MAG TPA: polysaccharide biosynthesis/export family protein [Armatimonadota bacterium]|nr:polysaccharide biosynthesis/export family protein [Armatimonadota bacterium]